LSNNIENFKYWIQKTLPSVYDDTLSFYELLGKTIAKLNEVIDQFNLNNVELDNEKIARIADVKKLTDDLAELRIYIDDSFLPDKLEFVLDEWYDNGKLASIINNEVFDMKADKTTLDDVIIKRVEGKTYPTNTLAKLKSFQSVKGVAIGDSITAATSGSVPYPAWFRDTLAFVYNNEAITVTNKGVPGERADQGLSRFTNDVVNDVPDFVVIMFGSNEAIQNSNLTTFQNSMVSMVELALKNNIEVVLMSVLPNFYMNPDKINIINSMVKRIAEGYGVCFVDLNTEITKILENQGIAPLDLMGDGVHPKWSRENKLISDVLIKDVFYPLTDVASKMNLVPLVSSKSVFTDIVGIVSSETELFKRHYLMRSTGGVSTGTYLKFFIYNDMEKGSQFYLIGNKVPTGGKINYFVTGVDKGEINFHSVEIMKDFKFPLELDYGFNIIEFKVESSSAGVGGGHDIEMSGFGVNKVNTLSSMRTPLLLQNGWTHTEGTKPANYTVNSNGMIHLNGLITKVSGGLTSDGIVLFTLPLEARPSRFVSVICSTEKDVKDYCVLYIDTMGNVSLQGFEGQNWLSLDGVSFYK
jgi:lysophospholipase L1-like esterase